MFKNHNKKDVILARSQTSLFVLFSIIFLICAKLFYWQILKSDDLSKEAINQYSKSISITGNRGTIYTSDGYPLVTNKQFYTLFAQPKFFTQKNEDIIEKIIPILLNESTDYLTSTESGKKREISNNLESQITESLKKNNNWISLKSNISESTKKSIEDLNIKGLGFDSQLKRYYPEGSMAAHLTGFVGKNENGEDIGYFGVEGALENELKARTTKNTVLTDAVGLQLSGKNSDEDQLKPNLIDGRNVILTIRRDIQNLIENELEKAIQKYDAKAGEIIIMEPSTGKILGLAAYPNYNQKDFYNFEAQFYKNPTLSNLYEPGSTLKALTVSAGIQEGLITPETKCDICTGPRTYGQYTIKTWNNEYIPDITMEEGLAKSDNTAMIFIAEKLGIEKFREYLRKFKIGDEIKIDLQEDHNTPFPEKWGEVKLATTSFGQGILSNSMQIIRAVNTIANHGEMVRPSIIEYVEDKTNGNKIIYESISEGQIISPQTAQTVTKMLISAAQHGEAQWIASKTYPVAGKTGTSQVVTENGYDSEKTIASFIGFSPPENPKFIMITKLVEPKSSPWAAETAAPLWYKIADKLNILLNISPVQNSEESVQNSEVLN